MSGPSYKGRVMSVGVHDNATFRCVQSIASCTVTNPLLNYNAWSTCDNVCNTCTIMYAADGFLTEMEESTL